MLYGNRIDYDVFLRGIDLSLANYLVTIGALAVLTTISQMLLPSGKLKKTVNVVFQIILIISIINPLTKISLNFDEKLENKQFNVDQTAVGVITDYRIDVIENNCLKELNKQGVCAKEVEILATKSSVQITIEKVVVILDETSISDENEHIIISQRAVGVISDLLSVDKEAISVW